MIATALQIPTLTTERLVLRAPRATDRNAYVAFRMSDRSRGVGGPYSREESHEHFASLADHWHSHGFGRWILECRSTGAALGLSGIMFPDDWPEPEIAWSLYDGAEGKGFATEAALAARAYAHDVLGWTRIVSLILPDNPRSVAVARRLGATHESDYTHPRLGSLQVWRHRSPEDAA